MHSVSGQTKTRPRPERGTSLLIRIYGLFATCCLALFFPFRVLVRRHPRLGAGLDERLGRIPDLADRDPGQWLIWIHAASMGEIQAAGNLIAILKTTLHKAGFLLTVTSSQGWHYARRHSGRGVTVTMAPLDVPMIVNRVIRLVRPNLFVSVETELWPVLLSSMRKNDIPMLMVNGRLSARSARLYGLVRGTMTELLAGFETLCVISERDRQRFLGLGVQAKRIRVCGNSKYGGIRDDGEKIRDDLRKRLGLGQRPVFISGSTRRGEEEILIPVFQALCRHGSDWHWILAPRHLRRLEEVEKILTSHGLALTRLSSHPPGRRPAPVILVDRMGLLSDLYAAADRHFCGGSLVDKGGHNIMEVIRWGQPVYFGPHMDDFQDAAAMVLESGAGFQVRNGEELRSLFEKHIARPHLHEQARQGARTLAGRLGQAARQQADAILERLPADSGRPGKLFNRNTNKAKDP